MNIINVIRLLYRALDSSIQISIDIRFNILNAKTKVAGIHIAMSKMFDMITYDQLLIILIKF